MVSSYGSGSLSSEFISKHLFDKEDEGSTVLTELSYDLKVVITDPKVSRTVHLSIDHVEAGERVPMSSLLLLPHPCLEDWLVGGD